MGERLCVFLIGLLVLSGAGWAFYEFLSFGKLPVPFEPPGILILAGMAFFGMRLVLGGLIRVLERTRDSSPERTVRFITEDKAVSQYGISRDRLRALARAREILVRESNRGDFIYKISEIRDLVPDLLPV